MPFDREYYMLGEVEQGLLYFIIRLLLNNVKSIIFSKSCINKIEEDCQSNWFKLLMWAFKN